MKQEKMFELLIYMIASAAGLRDEPKIYGPLRLIEASERLTALMLEEDKTNGTLKELIAIIENGKGKNSTDEEAFYQMLDDAIARLTDCL